MIGARISGVCSRIRSAATWRDGGGSVAANRAPSASSRTARNHKTENPRSMLTDQKTDGRAGDHCSSSEYYEVEAFVRGAFQQLPDFCGALKSRGERDGNEIRPARLEDPAIRACPAKRCRVR